MIEFFDIVSFNWSLIGSSGEIGVIAHLVEMLRVFVDSTFQPLIFRAQDPSSLVGGVGNAVAAMLQTKGQIDQANILVNFKEALEIIAALGWLFSVALGIGAMAVFGNYRQGLYLLIGPPLFYYMITTTATSTGTQLKIGDRLVEGYREDQNRLLSWVGAIGGDLGQDAQGNQTVTGNGTAEISLVFALFDAVVSEAIQAVVGVILHTNARDDLRFIGREKVLSYLLQAMPLDGATVSFIAELHMGECGESMSTLLRQNGIHLQVPVKYRDETEIEAGEQRVKEVEWPEKDIPLSMQAKRLLLSKKGTVFSDVGFNYETDEVNVSCEQVWNWVKEALFEHAELMLQPETFQKSFGDQGSDFPWMVIYSDAEEWLRGEKVDGGGAGNDPKEMLSVYMYRNALALTSHSALQSQVFSRSPFNSNAYKGVFGGLADAEAHGGYFRLKYFATTIPYIQGLLLYLLSIAFPFYAVFLVLPGKATSFLGWCALWVWVKSWDIGFALVFVCRDVFWYLLNGQINAFEQPVNWDFPSTVIRVAFNNDPLLTQNTHWILTSALTIMVPVLTAHFCMGAVPMFEMFKNSIDQTAARFGQVEHNRVRRDRATKADIAQWQKEADLQEVAFKIAFNHRGAKMADGRDVGMIDWNTDYAGGFLNEGFQGSPEARAAYAAASSMMARYKGYNTDPEHRADIAKSVARGEATENQLRAEQKANGRDPTAVVAHAFRGFMADTDKIPQTITDDNGNQMPLTDDEAFQRLVSDASPELKNRIASGEATMEDLYAHHHQFQKVKGEELTFYSRRRQMAKATQAGGGNIKNMIGQRQQTAMYARGPLDGMDTKTMAFGESLLTFLSMNSSSPDRPGIRWDGDAFKMKSEGDVAPGGDADVVDDDVEGGDEVDGQ